MTEQTPSPELAAFRAWWATILDAGDDPKGFTFFGYFAAGWHARDAALDAVTADLRAVALDRDENGALYDQSQEALLTAVLDQQAAFKLLNLTTASGREPPWDVVRHEIRRLQAAAAERDALKAALAPFTDPTSGLVALRRSIKCIFCARECDPYAEFEHRSSCPITKARALIGGAQ